MTYILTFLKILYYYNHASDRRNAAMIEVRRNTKSRAQSLHDKPSQILQ